LGRLTATLFGIVWLAAICIAPARAEPWVPRESVDAVDTARLLRAAARLYHLDPNLLAAIAAVESGGDPDAVSARGARGLMQLMPATAARFGVIDAFDPAANALGAARFLDWMRRTSMGRFDGRRPTLPQLLAGYNAGPGAVTRYAGVPPYWETRRYVRKVLIRYLFGADRAGSRLRLHYGAPLTEHIVTEHDDPLRVLARIRRMRAIALKRVRAGDGEPRHDAAGERR
jgi:soluble lytic murein transglycosylase-like protein